MNDARTIRELQQNLLAAESQLAIERQNCWAWEQRAAGHESRVRELEHYYEDLQAQNDQICELNINVGRQREALQGQVVRLKEALDPFPIAVSALDEVLMKKSVLQCYSDKVKGLRVSTEHYRYLAEQVIALREHMKRLAALAALPNKEAK